MKRLAPFVVARLIVGCSTENNSVNGENPPHLSNGVQVALYDSEKRIPTTQLEVFLTQEAVKDRPYRIIALLTRKGKREDEGLVMNAIAWRARQIGAEGLIPASVAGVGPSVSVNTSVRIGGGMWWGGDKEEEPVFRACAIVFTGPPRETNPKATDSN